MFQIALLRPLWRGRVGSDHVVGAGLRRIEPGVENLTLADIPCNDRKGSHPVELFLARNPKRLAKTWAGLKRPMKDSAAVNATR